jgi:predicted homoserine dehydrogenase-like protein
LRPLVPQEVTITAAHHPLAGRRLAVEGRRAIRGRAHLIVRLPDGTSGTVELQATSAAAGAGSASAGALLSVEGLRRLRRMLAPSAAGGDGSGT